MIKHVIKGLGILTGATLIFIGLMPKLGMITDWETVSDLTRLAGSIVCGAGIGLGIALIALCSGLLEWVYKHWD